MAGVKRRRHAQTVAKAAACQTTTEEIRNQRKGCSLKSSDRPDTDDILHLRLERPEACKRKESPLAADCMLASIQKARIPPATSTSPQRGSKLVKRSPKQIAAQQLADAQRRNADLLRQLRAANTCNERLSEAAEAEVIEARKRNASLTKNLQSLELQKQDLLKKLADKDKELIGAEARIADLQQQVTRLQGNKAVLHSRLGQKSSSMDSGASEALHTAQDSSEAAGTEDRMRCLQEEVARLQHDKSLMQNHLEDMGSELKAAEARAERLEAAQENAKLPCFPAGTTMQIHEALGMGSSGTVLKATLTQPVAIKRANRQPYRSGTSQRTLEDAEGDRVAQENVDFEARMLAIFKGHPDIVKAIGLIQEAGALGRSIVLELATHGSLARFLSHLKANKVDPDFMLQLNVARSCASGLQHIHDRGMCHNDFKPDNVLVFFEEDGSCSPGGTPCYRFRAKVADLGLLAKCDRHTGRLLDPWMAAGTKGYQHPGSLLDPATDGFADDRYAYGVMLWEMLGGQSAREHLADQLEALENLRPEQWDVVSAELARRGWDKDDMDLCVAVAHAFGFISLEEIQLKQGTDVPSKYVDLVRRLVSVDPRSEGPAWSEVLYTLDRLLSAAA